MDKNTHSDYIGALKRLNKIEDMITSLFDEIANFQERAPSTYNGDGELALEYDFWSAEQTLYGAISEARSNLETALKQRQNR